MTQKKFIIALLAALPLPALFIPSAASATGYLLPGTTRDAEVNYDLWDSPDSVIIPAIIDNSYYCRGIPFSGVDFPEFASSLAGPSSTTPDITFLGSADGLGNSESAFSFTAEATGAHSLSISADSTGSGAGSAAVAKLECFNTTLFGNFNTVTAANPVNFLEIKNISNTSLVATVVVRGFSGTEISRFSRTIAAGERQDVAIHDISGASNTFGSLTISHNGPLGGVVANVSKYLLSDGTLTITATEPLHERVQR